MNEAILIRFRSDDTVGFKGFSASYVTVSPFDEFEEESESAEITPFPGSLKHMYIKRKGTPDSDDYEEEPEQGTFVQTGPRNRIKNTVRNSLSRSSQIID
jgi:tolkin protein